MKWIIASLASLIISLGVFAQESRWTVSVLPGYQLNTSSYEYTRGCGNAVCTGKTQKGFTGSVDLALKLSEHYGVHFAYLVNDGKFRETATYYGWPWYSYDFQAPIGIWEIGPEWVIKLGTNGQMYFQANFGRTSSSGTASYTTSCGDYRLWPIREDSWVMGGAIGARYYFLNNAGIAAQVAYHRVSGWRAPEIWDFRLGVTFRF